MEVLWKKRSAFMKDLIETYPNPKPAATTVATLLKRMQVKGFVDYEQQGRSRKYFPIVKKKDYFSQHVKGLIRNFFDGNPAQFASFFTESTNLSKDQLEELKEMINQQLKKK